MTRFRLSGLLALAVVAPAVAQVDWQGRIVAPSPQARFGHAVAYDSARDRLVMFGGVGWPNLELAETWEWDGTTWLSRSPSTSPPGVRDHAMVYDAARARTVLISCGTVTDTETWGWDGSQWARLAPVGSLPRACYAAAYDAVRQRVVAVGNGLTWEWDGSAWNARPGVGPSARTGHSMVFDAARGVVVLFGGNQLGGAPGPVADTWEWDGIAWAQRASPMAPPGGDVAMTYDSARQRVVVAAADPGAALEAWEWDGVAWSRVSTGAPPSYRLGHTLTYHAGRQRAVLFGGATVTGYFGDTLGWDGGDWDDLSPPGVPPALIAPAMAFDLESGIGVLFGGLSGDYRSDVWEWNGTDWDQRSVLGPVARARHSMVYDRFADEIQMFGGVTTAGELADFWAYRDGAWHALFSQPEARRDTGLAYDELRRRTVLFGGRGRSGQLGDTWEWDRVKWLPQSPMISPTARSGHAMVFDPVNGVNVLFGGFDGNLVMNDTWTWDGFDWVLLNPATAPTPRHLHRMVYDYGRRRVVMFGGVGAAGTTNDVWEWDGTDWTVRSPANPPSTRALAGLLYDASRGVTVMTGGADSAVRAQGGTYTYAPTVRGTYDSVGPGCTLPFVAPTIRSADYGMPYVGERFDIRIGDLTSGSTLLVLIGLSDTQWGGVTLPFDLAPIGLPGCPLRVSVEFAFPLNPAGSAARFSMTIPNQPQYVGLELFTQVLVTDPGWILTPPRTVITEARVATIGID